MTGLEKILAEIRDEAAAEAQKAVDDATAQADKILAEAKAESDGKVGRIETAAGQDVKEIERSRESAIALQQRQRTLSEKQMLLGETLAKAQQSLYQLPEKDYFELLCKLAVSAAEPGEGTLLLNEKDKKRLPKGFEKDLGAALPKASKLSVAKETRNIDGGFVLKYGDIEQNCSFDAIFSARADEFSDMIRGTLFDD